MVEATAWWRCSPARKGGDDAAAAGQGLVQVPASHEGTSELRQGEYDHESANGLPTPEHLTGTHSQASLVSHVVQKEQGPQHIPQSLLRLGKPLIIYSRYCVTHSAHCRDLFQIFHLEKPAKITQ